MKLRMLTSVVKFAVATAIVAGVTLSASAQTAPAQPGASSGGYKIGVVDRKKVFDEYGKKKAQWNTLSDEKTKIETDLNAKFDALKTKKDAFDTNKATLSDEERLRQESTLSKEYTDLKSAAQNSQSVLDKKGELIIKGLRKEIDSAVQAIGEADNYHLILEADTAFSSVIYFSIPLDLTTKVIEYVNAHSGDAPAAPKAEKSDTKKKP